MLKHRFHLSSSLSSLLSFKFSNDVALCIFINIQGQFESPTLSITTSQTHTSDRPILKMSYLFENLDMLTRPDLCLLWPHFDMLIVQFYSNLSVAFLWNIKHENWSENPNYSANKTENRTIRSLCFLFFWGGGKRKS